MKITTQLKILSTANPFKVLLSVLLGHSFLPLPRDSLCPEFCVYHSLVLQYILNIFLPPIFVNVTHDKVM